MLYMLVRAFYINPSPDRPAATGASTAGREGVFSIVTPLNPLTYVRGLDQLPHTAEVLSWEIVL